MSRWIDAEWLISLYKPYENYKGREWGTSIGTILANIDDAPSIDIVRCKECEHSYEWDSGCGAELVCKARRCDPGDWGNRIEFYVKPDDFCSYGKKDNLG